MRFFLLLLTTLLLVSPCVYADSYSVFNVNASFYDYYTAANGTITGTVTLDTTTLSFTDSDLTVAFGGTTDHFTGAPRGQSQQVYPPDSILRTHYSVDFATSDPSALPAPDFVNLQIPVDTLADYAGGPLCSMSYYCAPTGFPGQITDFQNNVLLRMYGSGTPLYDEASSGSLTLASGGGTTVTPEPASLALLGTGLLGTVFIVSRRAPRKAPADAASRL